MWRSVILYYIHTSYMLCTIDNEMNIPGAGVIVNHETTGGELVYEEKGKY